MKGKNLIGRKVTIIDKTSWYYQDWGIIQYFNDGVYGVAIANGKDNIPIFDRDQFKLVKNINSEGK